MLSYEITNIIEKYRSKHLTQILMHIKKETVFLSNGMRLLSEDEILNYKKYFNIDIEIIPLIDLSDNTFLVFNPKTQSFQLCDISNEFLFSEIKNINYYIKILTL